jgi:hypothetical protein
MSAIGGKADIGRGSPRGRFGDGDVETAAQLALASLIQTGMQQS